MPKKKDNQKATKSKKTKKNLNLDKEKEINEIVNKKPVDTDKDGIINDYDKDIDGDGIDDRWDDDIDGDGIKNFEEDIVVLPSEDKDIDDDGIENKFDDDVDGDGIINEFDDDIDGDGEVNEDDADIDGDGILNKDDADMDGDGILNKKDKDMDGDGISNKFDKDEDGDAVEDEHKTIPSYSSVPGNSEMEVLVTKEGLKKLKEELNFLEHDRRKEIANRLQEAISYGDLSENSEYQEAKEEQAFVEGRIAELAKKIKYAKIISDQHSGKVNLGSVIELKNLTLKENENYTVVGVTEVDPFEGRISNESPLGKAVIGKRKNDKFSIKAPAGVFEYKVLKVS